MELRDYLYIIRRRFLVIVLCITASLLAGFIWLRQKPTVYKSLVSVITNYQAGEAEENSDYFRYNNYYGTLIAQSFNESITGLLKNTGVVQDVFEQGEISFEDKKIKTPSKYFKSVPKAKHVTEVNFTADSYEDAENLSNSLIVILQQKADEFVVSEGEGKLNLGIEGPVIEAKEPPVALYLAIFAIVSLGASIALVMLIHYLSDETNSSDEIAALLDLKLLSSVKALPLENEFGNVQTGNTNYIQLRDQLLSELGTSSDLVKIGITGYKASVHTVISALNKTFENHKQTHLLDISKSEQIDAKNILHGIEKHKHDLSLVYLPHLFAPNQNIEIFRQMNFLLIVLPQSGLKRSFLRSLANFITQINIRKGLVLIR